MLDRLKNLWHYATTRSGRTIAALEDENDKLRQQMVARVMDETFVTGLYFSEGGVNLGVKGGAAQLLAEMLAEQIESTGAVNYLEVSFTSRHIAPGSSYVVTIQKCTGKTPHQLRMSSEKKLAELRETLTPNVEHQRPRSGPLHGPVGPLGEEE